jgi:hypothetical protein
MEKNTVTVARAICVSRSRSGVIDSLWVTMLAGFAFGKGFKARPADQIATGARSSTRSRARNRDTD